MRITGARVATGPSSSIRRDVTVSGESPRDLDLSGHLILPGLINSHDHLEFNLFPRLGNRLYANASEWASDIFRPESSPVLEHLTVPERRSAESGVGLRNLLSGVTTVAHHNPCEVAVFDRNFPRCVVVRQFGWAHSPGSVQLPISWRNVLSPPRLPGPTLHRSCSGGR